MAQHSLVARSAALLAVALLPACAGAAQRIEQIVGCFSHPAQDRGR